MAKMKCPENCGGCYVGGQEYTVDEDGFITVPEEFVSSLLDHGYTVAAEQPKPKPETAAQKKAREKAEAEAKAKDEAEAEAPKAE